MSRAEPHPGAAVADDGALVAAAPGARDYRMLLCSWSELDIASGTPVIVCDILRHFSPTSAEVLTELNVDQKRRRKINVEQQIHRYRFHAWLWPFARGHRIRNRLARLCLPVLVAQLVRQIRRFRPDCILAIYAQPHWIAATWMASKITDVPLLYHVHDAFLEADERRMRSEFSQWLERKALTSTRVLALDDHMAEHYAFRYGIRCTVLRHIVRHEPLPAKSPTAIQSLGAANGKDTNEPRPPLTIGFAGAIYESNSQQLAELCRLVHQDPTLRLRIWTGSQYDTKSICGPKVEVAFESNYERLLGHIATCDLLYLPMQFFKGANMAAKAMAFSLPTKSFDYALSGVPILVHCPEDFSLSRFFANHRCGYVLNDPGASAVRDWLDAWRSGKIPPLDDADRLKTLAMHSEEANKRTLWQVIGEEVEHRTRRSRGLTS